ncbi:DNA polymerase/3'-5' exonuclease PolX [Sporolactobacillus shoreicorticis]|uniref:DNA polymerase beta n=1 Tax=Sporolactobacillus shoreicorticis TaxID=1923877 RepID=A0ABW5RYN2_9BACL|nr:DNA polymerase/3'-5' exonuclease PolX [Sporolactobacillus shoreicorticis]MCO7124785.1 DNA polymerase/3'-5' exonuclease PolX [Sporolactobacillus shoreicorticis]
MKIVNKKQIINQLDTIALYLEIKGENPFKVAAYHRAGLALENDPRSMAGMSDLSKIKGIGKSTAQVIEELLARGESSVLLALEKDIPHSLLDLLRLPGLGGKKIGKLYRELGVVDRDTLKDACEQGKVSQLAGFGKKTEEHLLQSLNEQRQRPKELPIPYMIDLADQIERVLRSVEMVNRFSCAGSLRRAKEKMKDLDFVIETADPKAVARQLLEKLPMHEIVGQGDAKMTVLLGDPNQVSVDFRFATQDIYASMLLHFTGSKEHNVLLRRLAKERNEKISEYGIEREDGSMRTFQNEADIYHYFGLNFIPPQAREGAFELERAEKGPLNLIKLSDIKGDLHMHSTWSDGANTIAEMAEAMRSKGYAYACLTDHSQSLRVANGLSPERLLEQNEKVKKMNQHYDDFTLFSGIEMDILPDGSLDYSDDVLSRLDFVIASIHFSFSQDKNQIMKRLENACRNPYVRLIAHPTGRMLGKRHGYAVDVKRLIELAKETGTALELNASRFRLDLSSEWLGRVQEAGVKIAINTDSHSLDMMDDMKLGVETAIRAGIKPHNVINTWPIDQLMIFLKNKKVI